MNKKNFVNFGIVVFSVVALGLLSYIVASKWGPTDASTPTIWSNFWSVFNNAVLLATLMVVAYYTYETYHLRKATVTSNHLSFRPILVFVAPDQFCTVMNKGNGPAFNACLIIWDGKKFKITSDNTVPGVIPPSEKYLFNSHIELDSAGIKKKLPEFASLTDRIANSNHALFCLAYRDLISNRYYSITNGSGAKYDGVFEHGEVI